MSKRLPRSSIRVFDPNIGVTLIQGGPLTRGQALIRARGILGPDGFAGLDMGEFPAIFVRRPSGEVFRCGVGDTYEQALIQAVTSPEAIEWSDRDIELGNEIETAKDSLKKAQQEAGTGNMKRFFQGLADLWDKRDKEKIKNKENYELWKEGREEEYRAALGRTRDRATTGK